MSKALFDMTKGLLRQGGKAASGKSLGPVGRMVAGGPWGSYSTVMPEGMAYIGGKSLQKSVCGLS